MGAAVVNRNGVPVLVVDGCETPLIAFFGNYCDVGSDGRQTTCETVRMSAEVACIHLHSINVRLPWNQAPGSDQYREVDRTIGNVLAADPDTRLIVRFHSHPVKAFEDGAHGNLEPQSDFGDVYDRELTVSDKGVVKHISFASEIWESELLSSVRNLVQHFLSQPYRASILAIHPDNNEWFYPIDFYSVGDFSAPMLRRWRAYVRQKYKTAQQLAIAWGHTCAFDDLQIPTLEERKGVHGATVLDPKDSRRILDFNQFYNELVADRIINIGRTIKEASENQYLSLFFYGYLFEISNNYQFGAQQSGHFSLGRVLRSPYIDILAGPISYFERWDVAEAGGSYFMSPVDSVTANGKIWIQEDDARTYLKTGEGVCTPAVSLESTLNIARKNTANTIVHNAGTWFMDLPAEGWLKDPGIWQEIRKLKRIYSELHRQRTLSAVHSEVAVIVDEKSVYAMSADNDLMQALLYKNRYALSRMGLTCGYYLLDDLVNGKVPQAKMYVFLNAIQLHGDERAYINTKLKNQDCTLLWVYASGLMDENGTDPANIESLTGLPVRRFAAPEDPTVLVDPDATVHGHKPFRGTTISYQLDAFHPGPVSDTKTVSPLFYLEDSPIAIGTYRESQRIAVGCARTGRALSVFYGSPLLSTGFLMDLSRESGVHLFSDSGDDFIFSSRHFLAISAVSTGTRTVRLPQRSDVVDLLDGRLIGRSLESFELQMRKDETRLYGIDFDLQE